MTRDKRSKWDVLFYDVLISPLGFRAMLSYVIAVVAWWNGWYATAAFFAASALFNLKVRCAEVDIENLREELTAEFDRKIGIVVDRIGDITGHGGEHERFRLDLP